MASLEPAYVDEIGQELADHGLAVSQFIGAADFTHPNPEVRERELAQMCRNVDVAAWLGATCVRATAGQSHPGVDHAQGVDWAVDGLRRLVEYAEPRSVWIAYENHFKDYFWERPDFSQQPAVFLEILEQLHEVPLKVNFDFGNPVMIGEDPVELLRQVVDRTVHVHCSDRVRGEYPHQIAGQGSADFEAGFQVLRTAGYDMWLSSEYNGAGGLEGLTDSLRYIRQTWDCTA